MRHGVPGMRQFTLCLLGGLLLLAIGQPHAHAGGQPSAAAQVGKAAPITMEQWAKVRQEADDAMSATRGDERIARCEAFLRDHPDYPDPYRILMVLVEAYVDTGRFDPARLAELLEQASANRSLNYVWSPEFLVSRYYFKHKLPLDSAERLLKKGRAQVAVEETALAKMPESSQKDSKRYFLAMRKASIELSEGRILLTRGSHQAALDHLLRAESIGFDAGWLGPSLQPAGKGAAHRFPGGFSSPDNLNLALATAYLRGGDKKRAKQRLSLVNAFMPELYPEVALEREKLFQELDVHPPAPREFRAEAVAAEDFRLKDLDGKEVALSDFKDRVVLAMFWATW